MRRLLRPAADALLRDAEAAGDIGLAEAFVPQAQGSQAAAFESFEIAFDSRRITPTYKMSGMGKITLYYAKVNKSLF